MRRVFIGNHFKPGDILFLYTDGVTEAENSGREAFSEERFRAAIATLQVDDLAQIVDGVRADIARHAQGQPQSDDITLLALRFNGPIGQ